ncbi:MAG: hypothetical protein EBQ96_02445 [Proteobacteria bacterium]|nr:hypothetical protein [Pseudomonadota bacterium]
MIEMDGPTLEKALAQGARENFDWAVDQARIVAMHARNSVEKMGVLGKFASSVKGGINGCAEHSVRTLFEIAARADRPNRETIVSEYAVWLQTLGKKSKDAALSHAVATVQSLVAPRIMRDEAVGYIIRNTNPATSPLFKTVCVAASERQINSIITKLAEHGKKAPYTAMKALDVLLEYGRRISGPQLFLVGIMRDGFANDPRTNADELAAMGIMVVLPDTGVVGSVSPRLQ